uniref:Uncharacterized protein n=1 Tax=Oryza punctata TaxID=4537 RepID=A0A0E0JYJ1_ORYPU
MWRKHLYEDPSPAKEDVGAPLAQDNEKDKAERKHLYEDPSPAKEDVGAPLAQDNEKDKAEESKIGLFFDSQGGLNNDYKSLRD